MLCLSEGHYSRAAPARLLHFKVSFSHTQSTQSHRFFSKEDQAGRPPLVLTACSLLMSVCCGQAL